MLNCGEVITGIKREFVHANDLSSCIGKVNPFNN